MKGEEGFNSSMDIVSRPAGLEDGQASGLRRLLPTKGTVYLEGRSFVVLTSCRSAAQALSLAPPVSKPNSTVPMRGNP